jgi:phage terminase large subunit
MKAAHRTMELDAERLQVRVARSLIPLLAPKRYKGAYGGRGGAKSHFFAEQKVLRCYTRPTRAVCIRETQNSIRDSVRQLLIDKIQKLGLGGAFNVLDNEIRGPDGSLIIFKGMQSYNAETIKSLEAYDIAWIEEAQTLSAKSLELLRPTLRKEGSELWFSWNPRHRTDAVDKFFRKNPHPDAISVMVNWRDNPWFPDVLRREMLHDKASDPIAAEHVWEGGYGMQAGAILARWVDRAEKQGRINDRVEFDPKGSPIEITSDIGFRDTAAWWFWQRRVGGYSLLDYDADSGLDAQEWIVRLRLRLEMRGWLKLGKIWLPHDARVRTFQSRHSTIEQFLTAFGAGKCDIVEMSSKADRINAARTVIKRCEFHETNCELGLDGLRAWEFEYNPDLQVFMKEPKHTWASHPSDGFSYGCQVMQTKAAPTATVPGRILQIGANPPANQVTIEDLWAENERKNRRR